MFRQFLLAKIHGGVITQCDLNYEGSCGLGHELLEASGIRPLEKVLVLNVSTGNRLETYAIGSEKRGEISLNGAAARYGAPGDKVIIIAFAILTEQEIAGHQARVLILNERNEVTAIKLERPTYVVGCGEGGVAGSGERAAELPGDACDADRMRPQAG